MSPTPSSAGVSKGSARLRLTLLYSAMFLALGALVVALLYLFTSLGTAVHGNTLLARPPFGPGVKLAVPDLLTRQQSADKQRLLSAAWVVLIFTTIGSSILGWFIAGRVLRPLRAMTDTAQKITAQNLDERLALGGREDEFKRLGDTIDELLDRLQSAFESQRRFVANAAHELRTPLTLDRALLQVALADPHASAEKLRGTCEELLTSGREQELLLDALLTLASSERGLERIEPVDLALLAGRVAGAQAEGEVKTLTAPAPTSGDPALLERLIANLLENAIRHNDERGLVELTTGTDSEGSYVSVENTGPHVADSSLQRLFEPFSRIEELRRGETAEHHGLGLSIVRSIANAHHASIQARARDEGGLTIKVSFPHSTR